MKWGALEMNRDLERTGGRRRDRRKSRRKRVKSNNMEGDWCPRQIRFISYFLIFIYLAALGLSFGTGVLLVATCGI